ncbi:NACHT, LRR and PYD domains-containing protein 6-like, partial [Cololabis saira]|uniref:NACHT, LRR and PYD domains-containing protein 6-like n=1 Tax=Cololabis saira TaxID=129043 RepID=UPI002AD2FEF7
MDQCEDREEGVLPSKTSPRGKPEREEERRPGPGPGSEPESETESGLGPSCVSMKSDASKDLPILFKESPGFPSERRPGPGPGSEPESETESGLGPSCVSMKSDASKDLPILFKESPGFPSERVDQQISESPSGPSVQQHQTQLDSVFQLLEDDIIMFVKDELKKILKVLSPVYPESSESLEEDEDEEQKSIRETLVKITVKFLRRRKQEKLADLLQRKTIAAVCQSKLKRRLQKKYRHVSEGITKAGKKTSLEQIYTELYITEGGTGEVNEEHEVRQIEAASRKPDRTETAIRQEDIFKPPPGRGGPIRTVMTKGVAGIGKTVLTQKFSLDWAEGRTNQDIQFLLPFTFRQLNVLREETFSLVELVHGFFSETKRICSFEEFQVVFIFDGLDESRLPLDFHNSTIVSDPRRSTSVDVLLTNLIRGNLLPSARLWITTRPAAANQIPPECVDMVTEVRGFTDSQKEEYFRKRFRGEEQTSRIISHIKTSRSLHIMCHIPVFCWITATVLENVLETREGGELPKTLTEMYIHFLVVQAKLKKVKYDGGAGMDPHWSPESRKMVESLGKLAFEQLQKGNLIFYESDLRECGINVREASVYSGVFTQIFREESNMYENQVFCFIHLTVQEFLAALHVHQTFINSGVNLLEEQKNTSWWFKKRAMTDLYQTAVDKALQSPNGHLDLFLRFLLGLSLETNQTLLRGLMTSNQRRSQNNQETVQYIKEKISENMSAERSINLFHCLNELNDRSLVEEVQQSLRSGRLSTDKLSPAQWSALVFILLSSGEDLEVFDLKKFSASEKVLQRLLPVVKASKKVLLSDCNLSGNICPLLSSVLSSQSSSLTELDLSNNDLQDSGLEQLCPGLESRHCHLESLRLSGCLISEEGTSSLVSALTSNPSHLRELDLSYNHPGESAGKLLSRLEDPCWRLDTLRVEPAGQRWLTPGGLRKYSCQLTIDTNTVHNKIKLSDDNREMMYVEEDQSYPDHPDRFDVKPQLLCREVLTGRCYWEVERRGGVSVSVNYRRISRRGNSDDCVFGRNDNSWSLDRSPLSPHYQVWHNNRETSIPYSSSSSSSARVALYVDVPAGTLSFYEVVSNGLIHIHTFNTTFTEPLCAGFGLWSWLDYWPGSSQLTVDTNTVHNKIKLSDNNRKMMFGEEEEEVQSYPDHPDRFDHWEQLLCREVLTGRCYWEVQWSRHVSVSVSYRRISRKGNSGDCWFGGNDYSWSLDCDPGDRYRVYHNKRLTPTTSSSPSPDSNRAAVYVDVPAGTLSFYEVSVSDRLIHIHTFNTSFTE